MSKGIYARTRIERPKIVTVMIAVEKKEEEK